MSLSNPEETIPDDVKRVGAQTMKPYAKLCQNNVLCLVIWKRSSFNNNPRKRQLHSQQIFNIVDYVLNLTSKLLFAMKYHEKKQHKTSCVSFDIVQTECAKIKDCITILWHGPGLASFPVSTKWTLSSVQVSVTFSINMVCN